jgi:uncharacterized membrane protein
MDREWTDKRLDDLADRVGRFEGNVDRRFDKVDDRFEKAEVVTKERFEKADALEKERFAAVHAELAVASKKADKMNWTLIGGVATILATSVGKILLG